MASKLRRRRLDFRTRALLSLTTTSSSQRERGSQWALRALQRTGGNGVQVVGNAVNCNGNYGDGGALGSTKSVGFWIAGGAPIVDQNDFYRCAVGTKVVPTLPGQLISGTFSGWLGDTCTQHELMIGVDAGLTGSQILVSNFDGWYIGQVNYGNIDQPILIYNKGGVSAVHSLVFTGGIIHDGGGPGGAPVNDFWLVTDDVNQLTIVGNHFYNDGNATGPAFHSAASGNTYITLTGNTFSGNPWSNAIKIDGTGDLYTIVGNHFSNATLPINWTTLNPASSRATIRANSGVSGLFEYNGPVLSLTGEGNNTYAQTYGDNTNGLITLTAGATPGQSGNVRLNFNRTAPHAWSCAVTLGTGWAAAATTKVVAGSNFATLYWYNAATNLTTGGNGQIFYNGCAQQ